MRGTHQAGACDAVPDRIIPAHAGNTLRISSRSALRKDHPRACGEHIADENGLFYGKGSSPRMRGTLIRNAELVEISGIIPAHAGNTLYA